MISLPVFLRSPLARHPGLFVRKAADRLGLRSKKIPPVPAGLPAAVYPTAWRPALAESAGQQPAALITSSALPPFHRVFGQDFDESQLLRLCREGPERGVRGLTGDIKLIWDYSRGHALWANALHGNFDACAAFVRRWLEAAGDINGPAWSCAMDVAIRAVNWILADCVANGEISRRIGTSEWAQRLWQHGAIAWHRLETNLISNNHYLADLLGLAFVGSVFPGVPTARRWRAFARSEFPRALMAQTRVDGGLNEASTRYHAFVTEMALLTRLALAEPFAPATEARLRCMCQIIADLKDSSGDVFALGDDDSGQVLALDWTGSLGRAGALLRLGGQLLGENFATAPEAIYPESGWWVRRAGEFVTVVEFGGVGLSGLGGHAHNDDLSICVEWRGRPVIVDPGTYLYTSDVAARDEFRSARSHNSVLFDGLEPRDLGPGPFRLLGTDRALPEHLVAPGSRTFTRSVRTISSTCLHRRTVHASEAQIVIEDEISGPGAPCMEWRFHLHPGVRAEVRERIVHLAVPDVGTIEMHPPQGLLPEIETARHSPGYGQDQPSFVITAQVNSGLPWQGRWLLQLPSSAHLS